MKIRFFVLVVPGLAALACESATNLDVSYAAADASSEAAAAVDGGDGDAGAEGSAPIVPVEGCPCDTAAGLGCCVTSAGAYCTNSFEDCASAKGAWLRCAHRDAVFESECCWAGSGTGSQTRFAAACDGGAPACLTDTDCAGTGQSCKTVTCSGFTFGQCASTAPACPSP